MTALTRDPRAIALLMAAALTILSNATISPALPGIEAMFADTPNAALLTRLLVTAPSLMVAIVAPFAGLLADRFGRRRQLLAGVVVFAVAGSAGLYLDSLSMILASRLVLGVAVAAVMTAQAALVGDYFAEDARARFMGYQIAATNFSGLFFVLLAGFLAGLSPRFPFAIYGLAILLVPFFRRVITDPPRDDTSGTSSGQAESTDRTWMITVGTMAALSGGTFILFYILPTQMPFYLIEIGHTDPSAAGAIIAVMTLAGGIAALAFGPLRPYLGPGGAPALGYGVMAAGFLTLSASEAFLILSAGAAMVGGGFGFVMPNFITLALGATPAYRRGAAMGVMTTSIFLGQFLSPLVSQPLIDAFDYPATLRMATAVLIAAGVGLLIGLRQRDPASAVTPPARP